METKEKINLIYKLLLKEYREQGWWPLMKLKNKYHPKDYSYPNSKEDTFEICLGCILTQNTSWKNVDKALTNLYIKNLLNHKKIKQEKEETIKKLLKPAGYFNQKYNYIINFINFFEKLTTNDFTNVERKELLKIKGIGNETADSMLLYAFKQKEFVVDAYTKRILTNLKIIKGNEDYLEIKKLIENNFKGQVKEYQEYHALIVEHAKEFYQKKEDYKNDFLLKMIK